MEIARHWRLNAQRYRLVGSACPTCGELFFPPRPACPSYIAQTGRIAADGVPVLPLSKNTADPILLKES